MPQAPRPKHPRGTYVARQISGRLPGKLEALVALAVFAGVFGVAGFIFSFPGPLVVAVRNDAGEAVPDAVVHCSDPQGDRTYSGVTDVFGETKWPGIAKGPWSCELWPPPRYHGEKVVGGAVVVARSMAMWKVTLERPVQFLVHVQRPLGAPRANLAVRGYCPPERGQPAVAWEARAGLMDGLARLWLPKGRSCRAGLVRPELPEHQPGLVARPGLDCDQTPCTPAVQGGVGAYLEGELTPTPAQWLAVRPPIEPDPVAPGAPPDAGAPAPADGGAAP